MSSASDFFAQLCLATASFAGLPIETVIVSSEMKASKEFKPKMAATTGSLPILETAEGAYISETIAICKYLARVGPDAAGLMGSSALEQVKVEQTLSFAYY